MDHPAGSSAAEIAGFEKLLECAPDAMVVADRHGRILLVNSLAETLFGQSRETLIGASVETLVPQRLRDRHVQMRDDYSSAPRTRPMSARGELRALRADGTDFPAEISLSPFELGGTPLIAAAIRDVTQQHQVRHELALNYQIQSAISALLQQSLQPISLEEQLYHTLDVLLAVDCLQPRCHGAIYLAQEPSQELVLRAWRAASQGRDLSHLAPPAARREPPRQHQPYRHASGGYCVPIVDKDRLLGVLELHVPGEHQETAEETRFLAAVTHVLAGVIRRKQAEELLSESEERFELAVKGTDAGIWDWDLRSNRVHFATRWKSQLGYGDEEIQDNLQEWESRIHPDDHERALETIRRYLHGESSEFELEHRLKHKDGSYRWILTRGAAVRDEKGAPYRMVGSNLDITERKRSEHLLKDQEAQLIAARKIQEHLLPSSAPDVPGFDIAGGFYAAQYTAGDYFDYLWLPDGTLALVIGDVSGHGFSAALLMASIGARLRVLAETIADLSELLRRLNHALVDDTEDGRFATMLIVRIDLKTRAMEFISAGHTPAYLLNSGGETVEVLRSTHPPLGIIHNIQFETVPSARFEPGYALLMMTDGLIEAQSSTDEVFGEQHAVELMRENLRADAATIVDRLHRAVCQFTEGEELQDDVTLVMVKATDGSAPRRTPSPKSDE